jgi:hypothetical protein
MARPALNGDERHYAEQLRAWRERRDDDATTWLSTPSGSQPARLPRVMAA